jgi:hypothetical protein
MRRILSLSLLIVLAASTLSADVSIVERRNVARQHAGKEKPEHARRLHPAKSLNGKSGNLQSAGLAIGEQPLTDASGLEFFINTNITFTTSSSASGAASEASYTGPVAATTSAGGTVSTTLTDSFDGYNALCVSTTGATGPCATGDADYTVYNDNGAATLDASCGNRQVILPVQTIGTLSVQRKVLVPANDSFARWFNTVTNNGGAAVNVTLVTSNNLGSDAGTTIVSSSSGDAAATTADTWVTTFESFTGSTSTDVRLGHVLQGAGAPTPLISVTFANGDDNPFWAYTFSLAPGETKAILNFVTGQPSRAAANAKAAALAGLPATATQCLTPVERAQVVNFAPALSLIEVPTLGEIGLLALGLLLAAFALFKLRTRRS